LIAVAGARAVVIALNGDGSFAARSKPAPKVRKNPFKRSSTTAESHAE
jgi:hypothetical protein